MIWRRVRAMARLELRLAARNGENLLVSLGVPVGLLVFFSLVPVLPTPAGVAPVDFLVPGVLTAAVMGAAMVALGIGTGFERGYLVLKRLGATPLRRGELVAAKVLGVLVAVAVQVIAVAGVAAVLGWRPTLGAAGWALGALLLVLGVVAFAGVGLALAGTLPALGNLAAVNALFVVLLLISGVVFPLSALPPALAAGARLLPSAALAEALRSVLGAGSAGTSAWLLGAWAALAPLLAALSFRWE